MGVVMRICDSEENRRKLAWLVPGYILLAWFFCVVFQPLGLTSMPGHGNNNDYNMVRVDVANMEQAQEAESAQTRPLVTDSSEGAELLRRQEQGEAGRIDGASAIPLVT